ncbi:putative u2 snrnp component ist3 protein [Phaeoacremonium minimum UCRPA7]|uniref:Putative u2 snrnp component ist3 protein n=1 Tax=Phaeoacremonium minimum (strain UCR-PA7) TaxID=1286976 RepID=R8BJS9_PHAM7|nr:putative u2 snrnp component ist3 protein [Phaeoacremonium minimum UCRPA7]EON99580.1 putative u2 snrnp component ist3 protein [Phaeoacremonium minimum UCRPA7]
MNKIRAIQELNKREIENGISPSASWHVDYRDTAFVYFGGLPFELSEGDVITIFSQFGEPTFLKLARDKETGKSRGFGWLKYEDQRSTDLAVDNLGGATISGRMISVDHARYKPRDDDDPEEGKVGWEDIQKRERAQRAADGEAADTDEESEDEPSRPMLKEERELLLLKQNHDDDDPMKAYLIEEKEREVAEALRKEKKRTGRDRKERTLLCSVTERMEIMTLGEQGAATIPVSATVGEIEIAMIVTADEAMRRNGDVITEKAVTITPTGVIETRTIETAGIGEVAADRLETLGFEIPI